MMTRQHNEARNHSPEQNKDHSRNP